MKLLLFLVVAASVAAGRDESATFIVWARANAVPLRTVEAGNGFDDMRPLHKIIGDAGVVALGEATHGTREFFQLKHRIVEYLATELGFNVFAIEANMPEAARLNDFVLKGEGDPRQLIKGMYFWTWDTEEVLDMVLWMREFNRSGKGRIEFTGFDMQSPALAMETVRAFVKEQDGNWLATLNQAYNEIPRLPRSADTGPAFGVATARFPVLAAAGRHVTFSGFIKTQAVTQGYAGLWWRVDGPPGAAPLAFDNMQRRGVTGTTPWTRYEISLDVPPGATNINFGVLHPGNGTAWFDSLQVALDGQIYPGTELFDPDFESSSPRGFYTGGSGYQVALDPAEANTGRQSLRSRFVSIPASAQGRAVTPAAVAQACRSVLAHLETNRPTFVHARQKDVEWAIQNARIVLEYAQMMSGEKTRDESMADNIQWIAAQANAAQANQFTRTRVIVWAHNGHVAYSGYPGLDSMGGYLRKAFDASFVNFGVAFNQGSFRAVEPGKQLREFTVGPAPEGSLDRTLAQTGIPLMALDLRLAPKQSPAFEWLNAFHPARNIGAVYSESVETHAWNDMRIREAFDALLFIERTSAARTFAPARQGN